MIDKTTYKRVVAAPFERAGFTKKGQKWYLDGKAVLIVINLQQSDWEAMYYINVGFWIKGLGEAVFPSHNHCHLHYRVENLFPEKRELIISSCSLENSGPDVLDSLSQFIDCELIPLLKECTEEQKLRELMAMGKLNNGIVLKGARDYLLKA